MSRSHRPGTFALSAAALVLALSLVHPYAVAACVCADAGTFLDAVSEQRVSVLRIRVLTRTPTTLGPEVIRELLGIHAPRKGVPASGLARAGQAPGDLAVSAAVVEQLTGPRARPRVAVAFPRSAYCGPADLTKLVEGTQWYVAAVALGSDHADETMAKYVAWAPCMVSAVRVCNEHVVGEIRGKSERMPVRDFRELVKAAAAQRPKAEQDH